MRGHRGQAERTEEKTSPTNRKGDDRTQDGKQGSREVPGSHQKSPGWLRSQPPNFPVQSAQSVPEKATATPAGPSGLAGILHCAPAAPFANSGEKERRQSGSLVGLTLSGCGEPLLQRILEGFPLRSQHTGKVDKCALYPLPTSRDVFATFDPSLDSGMIAWMVCVCICLNSFWGGDLFSDAIRNDGQRECLEGIAKDVKRFCSISMTLPMVDWGDVMKTKNIDYKGDEVKVARWFQWSNVSPALPAEVGCVPLAEVCERGCRDYVLNFEDYLKPESEWVRFKPPRVMVADEDWGDVCDGLVQQGVCTYIAEEDVFHTPSGELRLPDISERECMLGFPVGFTLPCVNKSSRNTEEHSDIRKTLLGNTWSVPVVAVLLGHLFHQLGWISQLTPQEVLRRCQSGQHSLVQGRLLRLPLNPCRGPSAADPYQLAFKLGNLVSIKGEDVLLCTPSSQLVKYHRLRASVPSRLWKWRIVSGWRWVYPGEHINALELRAVLASLRYRLEHRLQFSCRMIHLVDSLVCLHALARGRSSSRRLRRTLARVNALILAGNVQPDRAAQRRKLGSLRLTLPKEKHTMDALLCDFLEHLWSSGAGRAQACDTLAGVTVLQLERALEWKDSLVPGEEKELQVPAEAQDKLREVFKKYSKEGGYLSRHDLTNLLQKLHPKWASGVASVLLKAADSNGDENLDYEEFLNWLLQKENEWTPIKEALMSTPEESPDSPTLAASGFSEMAADARERLLKQSAEENEKDKKEMSLQEAAQIKELHDIVKSYNELATLLKKFPQLDPVSDALSIIDFSSWSVPRLKEYISTAGHSLVGLSEKRELISLCEQIFKEFSEESEGVNSSSLEERESFATAECIDARLRCIRILQETNKTGPDPVQLAVAIRQAQRLLSAEPCETAILSHSQRLGMCAEDQSKSTATLPEMEQAVNLMHAVQETVRMPDGHKNCVTAQAVLEANSRLQQVQVQAKHIGIRSQCGPFVKMLSLKSDASLSELQAKLCDLWSKPLESLTFLTAEGLSLTEDKWQELLPGSTPIEVKMVLERDRRGSKAKSSKAASKSRPRPPDKACGMAWDGMGWHGMAWFSFHGFLFISLIRFRATSSNIPLNSLTRRKKPLPHWQLRAALGKAEAQHKVLELQQFQAGSSSLKDLEM
eukprot:Skav215577  [mRNA]  locus=scaffold2748:94123:102439:- [translate_table: standard]